MKDFVLKALNNDEQKLNLLLANSRQRDLVRLRWKLYEALFNQKYSVRDIATFFKKKESAVRYGLRQTLNPNPDKSIPKITGKVIARAGGVKGYRLYEELRHFGHSVKQIALYFKVSENHVHYSLKKAKEQRSLKELTKRRKSFVKF